MSKAVDLRDLLASWPYDPDDEVRVVQGDDGREILQVRAPVGIEQLEMTGRPDGARPHGMKSALEFHLQRLEKAKAAGHGADFELDAAECAELFGEGTLYYFRYLRLFQLKRWADTVRDTSRNLRLFDFVHSYTTREEDQKHLEKWRPYIVRMNAVASAMVKLEKGAHDKALEFLDAATERTESLDEMDDETFQFERQRSLLALRELATQIRKNKPLSELDRLERQLYRAIERQEFERAAALRDQIQGLRNQSHAN